MFLSPIIYYIYLLFTFSCRVTGSGKMKIGKIPVCYKDIVEALDFVEFGLTEETRFSYTHSYAGVTVRWDGQGRIKLIMDKSLVCSIHVGEK